MYDLEPDSKPTSKIFFTPFVNDRGQLAQLPWHGRILPGQSIREGVVSELNQMQGYSADDFRIDSIEFQDYATDLHNDSIPRYKIVITLRQTAIQSVHLPGVHVVSARKMTSKGVSQLATILDIDADDFIQLMRSRGQEGVFFYHFFIEYLLEEGKNAIEIDWRWEPHDLVQQLQKTIKNHTFTLTQSTIQDGRQFNIVLSIDNEEKSLQFSLTDPNVLIAAANDVLDTHHFIEVDFDEDSYNWLLVPNEFNQQGFSKLTGYSDHEGTVRATPLSSEEEYLAMFYYEKIKGKHVVSSISVGIDRWQGKVRVHTADQALAKIFDTIISKLDPTANADVLSIELSEHAPKMVNGLSLQKNN